MLRAGLTKKLAQTPAERRAKLIGELKGCNDLARVKAIHESAIHTADASNAYVASTLINMYAKCGSMPDARRVLAAMEHPNVVSWTALILGYAANGEGETALDLFSRMIRNGCLPDATSFVAAIKACTVECIPESCPRGRTLHLLASRTGCDSQAYVQVTLLDMYAKFGLMEEAHEVFSSISTPNEVAWNALIMGYAENGEAAKAVFFFSEMTREGCKPNSRTLVAAIKAVSKLATKEKNLEECRVMGKILHLLSFRNTCSSDAYLQDALVELYARCLRMKDASEAFSNMQHPTVVSWNTLIMGYVENGESTMALKTFCRMRLEGYQPNGRTFVACLKACIGLMDEEETGVSSRRGIEQLHSLLLRSGWGSDMYVHGTLVVMYAKLGSMETARRVFGGMACPSLVSWTALISGYAENGEPQVALTLFSRLRFQGFGLDARILVSALKACTQLEASCTILRTGSALHLLALRSGCASDIYVEAVLVDMYARCGSMPISRFVFEGMKSYDVASWNALILGYADNGEGLKALDFLSRMSRSEHVPNSRTLIAALKACIDLAMQETNGNVETYRERGKALHLLALRFDCYSDMYLQGTLVDMYAKCRSIEHAFAVFESMKHPNVVAWTGLILGYTDCGESETALCFFSRMRSQGCTPNARTFVAVLKACTDLATKEEGSDLFRAESAARGKQLHLLASLWGFDSDVFVVDTLVDLYGKCGSMEDAKKLFDSMKHRNVVSWNALLFGYVDNGEGKVALDLFATMKREGYAPDERTFIAALKACAMLGALRIGEDIHAEIVSCALESDAALGNCLVDFYAKCGSLDKAQHAFDSCGTRNLVSWTALMTGYSRLGDTKQVSRLFDEMCEIGLEPNDVTFLCVLAACSHAGLVERGEVYFKMMSVKYGIRPGVEHHNCMIDILGRAEKLDHAMALLRSMRFTADQVAWMSVLGACKKWKNVTIGRLAFESLMSLEATNAAAFVLMANVYGSKGLWKDQAALQAMRKRLGAWKKPGKSLWTSEAGVVHAFLAGDRRHPQRREMDMKLKDLVVKMKEHGYVADLSSVTTGDMSDTEKEEALCGHSERLAIACALINTKPFESIRIIKNLRVCVDCHAATALISKIEHRTILCRDASRFHVFKEGKCSCNDFW